MEFVKGIEDAEEIRLVLDCSHEGCLGYRLWPFLVNDSKAPEPVFPAVGKNAGPPSAPLLQFTRTRRYRTWKFRSLFCLSSEVLNTSSARVIKGSIPHSRSALVFRSSMSTGTPLPS
jgi:hypothetical protein